MLLLNDVRLQPMSFFAHFKCLMLSTNPFFVLFYNASVRHCNSSCCFVSGFGPLHL